MATVWEQIQEKRTKVEEFQGTFQAARTKFAADGEIDADEQAKLDKITSSLNAAKAKVKELEAEFKANKAKWEGRNGDYMALKDQIDDLYDWGDPVASEIAGRYGGIRKLAGEMAWLDAITELGKVQVLVKGPHAEYKKQLPFRDQYDENHDKIIGRKDSESNSSFAAKDSIAKALTAFDGTIKAAEDSAGVRKFDDACRHLDAAKATVDDIENDIKELQKKHEEVALKQASVKGDAVLYATSKYKTVQELNEKMAAMDKTIEGLVDAFEYDQALAKIEINRQTVDQMKAEHEKKENEEEEWEKKQPTVQDAQKKAEEVKEFSGEEVDTKASEASGKASEEEFKKATEQAEQGAAEAEAAHQEMQKKKAERSSKLDDIQKQVADMLAELAD